jgi:hypothetical protein
MIVNYFLVIINIKINSIDLINLKSFIINLFKQFLNLL